MVGTVINSEEIKWMKLNHPSLKVDSSRRELKGEIRFTCSYNPSTDEFEILKFQATSDSIGGIILTGTFQVLVVFQKYIEFLPALYIVEPKISFSSDKQRADRHFRKELSACLCGAEQEAEYCKTGISLSLYIERLIIPFLYGQIFYDTNEYWAWKEHAHGATGIFESIYLSPNSPDIKVCVSYLIADPSWNRIKKLLRQSEKIKGHIPCFCEKGDQIRRCHPEAWKGLIKLQEDIKRVMSMKSPLQN